MLENLQMGRRFARRGYDDSVTEYETVLAKACRVYTDRRWCCWPRGCLLAKNSSIVTMESRANY